MTENDKKEILVVDLSVKHTSPAGSCVLSELIGLSKEYNIHLFSSEIDEELKKKVKFYQVKTPGFPLFLRYVIFSIRTKIKVRKFIKKSPKVSIIQTTQGQFTNSTISYPHFCHKGYLKKYWKANTIKGVKRISRKLNHLYNARMEAKAFKNAKIIVVPSEGLHSEIAEFYPQYKEKIKVISNPIDISYFKKPSDFDATSLRESLNINHTDIVIAFIALGDFARKGLPELMESLKDPRVKSTSFKILVIGGNENEINIYKKSAMKMGLDQRIIFIGFKQDVRPYIWISQLFSLPSLYEIFSLVTVQAAAAGLPLLVTKIHGVEEYLQDGKNGWIVERTPKNIAEILEGILKGNYNLEAMGHEALNSVMKYDHKAFREKWLEVYKNLN